MKLHLKAKVPNEGARRLARWLGEQRCADAAFESVARQIGSHVSIVDRLISGEIEPGAMVAHAVWVATEGAVHRRDWRRAPEGGWFDAPAPHTAERLAA